MSTMVVRRPVFEAAFHDAKSAMRGDLDRHLHWAGAVPKGDTLRFELRAKRMKLVYLLAGSIIAASATTPLRAQFPSTFSIKISDFPNQSKNMPSTVSKLVDSKEVKVISLPTCANHVLTSLEKAYCCATYRQELKKMCKVS